ncbi:MAG: Stp1/IreP family PP2C-type Ser/Thr phosphatase [Oscillospiraceae bacterium]|nr:Stp1/IreP family PP2C-type Ser/Thr phosphatase [Oscillospiraceae bacterium]
MIQIYGNTHCGMVREQNQDCFVTRVIDEKTGYAIVCDGMGGAKAGDVASSAACSVIDEHFKKNIRAGLSEITVRNIISSAMQSANKKVYNLSNENDDYRGMGTTVALVIVDDKKVYLAHVGDSRIYVNDGEIAAQLTTDHTVVQDKLSKGEITAEDARIHPQRHHLTNVLGVFPVMKFDYDLYEGFDAGMSLLLCSDGLSNYLGVQQLPMLLKQAQAAKSAEPLIEFANGKGGHDNVTAVVVAKSDR